MLHWLKKLFSKTENANNKFNKEVKYLIAGLGNIGPDYIDTRHNVGFMIVDKLAEKKEVAFSPARYGDKAVFRHKGRIFIMIKPSTYMNLSGKAINYWLTKEKVAEENLLVIVDDVALPLGSIRIKTKGGDGGHNGLTNISEIMGSNAYARLRFGIGNEFPKGAQVQFVLGKWTQDEMKILNSGIDKAADAVISFGTIGPERTMNIFNTK